MHHFITFVRTRESIHNPSHFHLAFKHCLPHFILLIFLTLFTCNIVKKTRKLERYICIRNH